MTSIDVVIGFAINVLCVLDDTFLIKDNYIYDNLNKIKHFRTTKIYILLIIYNYKLF